VNTKVIRYIIGQVIKMEGILLIIPFFISLIYREKEGISYLYVIALCFFLGIVLTIKKPKNMRMYLKEGCVITALSWLVMSMIGAIPFVLTKEIPSYLDALFETVSGFTTTGASILNDVEKLSRTSLFWRSFTHWIGGMGVLVFLLAVLPMTGGSNINLLRAESPGPSVGKFVPKLRYTARILYIIYFGMTMFMILLLELGNMPLFESVLTAMGTAGTGGFGFRNDSMASMSPYIQWVVTTFMILFGVNFNAYYLIIYKKALSAFKMEEVKYYLAIVFGFIAIVFFNILPHVKNPELALRQAAFQVGSLISSTGFSTVDYDCWNSLCKTVLVLAMFVGACAGSTGGGIKVSRVMIAIKAVKRELISYIHPKSINRIKVDDKPIEEENVYSVVVYFIVFTLIFIASFVLLSIEGKDLVTNFTAVLATLNNIGPGLSLVGPARNFAHLTGLSKGVLIFDMLAGRLELFPILILLHPQSLMELLHLSNRRKK